MSENISSKRTRRLVHLGLWIPCLLICVPALVAYSAERQLAAAFRWVSHTLEVQRDIQGLLSSLVDAETSQRGFLLTADETYLEPRRLAIERVPIQLATLRDLTADNPTQQQHLREIAALIGTRLDLMEKTMGLQRQGDHETAVAVVKTGRGKQAMDALRAKLGLMGEEEARLLQMREANLDSRARLSTGLLLGLVGLNVAFAAAMLVMYRRLAKAESLVTVCAWSRTVEYQGEWLSIEAYLYRRFNLNTSHGISPEQAEKVKRELDQMV